MMKGGDWHALQVGKEVREEKAVALLDIRRKVKGALAELHLALRTLDKLTGRE